MTIGDDVFNEDSNWEALRVWHIGNSATRHTSEQPLCEQSDKGVEDEMKIKPDGLCTQIEMGIEWPVYAGDCWDVLLR